MRKYKPAHGKEVDLDNPRTYSYLPKTYSELRNLMFREIGYTLCYMDWFPSRKNLFPKKKIKSKYVKMSDMFPHLKNNKRIDINNVAYGQRLRVYKLIKNFADHEHRHGNDLMWFKEQIFLFQDETENMC